MDFDTYFDQLVIREGEWLAPARHALKTQWPYVSPVLERAGLELYEEIFGKASDDALPKIDEWFYRANEDLGHRRPIDLMATPEGVRSVRSHFEHVVAGVYG